MCVMRRVRNRRERKKGKKKKKIQAILPDRRIPVPNDGLTLPPFYIHKFHFPARKRKQTKRPMNGRMRKTDGHTINRTMPFFSFLKERK